MTSCYALGRPLKKPSDKKQKPMRRARWTPPSQAGYVPLLRLTPLAHTHPKGTWGGAGTQKRPPKPHLIKSLPGIAPTARADHAKPHLIISEKRDKKAAKYLVRELPHPYTSHAQFERLTQTPLGSEWNTRVGFQRGTMPRVIKKVGFRRSRLVTTVWVMGPSAVGVLSSGVPAGVAWAWCWLFFWPSCCWFL